MVAPSSPTTITIRSVFICPSGPKIQLFSASWHVGHLPCAVSEDPLCSRAVKSRWIAKGVAGHPCHVSVDNPCWVFDRPAYAEVDHHWTADISDDVGHCLLGEVVDAFSKTLSVDEPQPETLPTPVIQVRQMKATEGCTTCARRPARPTHPSTKGSCMQPILVWLSAHSMG